MGVVSGGGIEAAIGSEVQHATVVTAFASLGGPFDDLFFISERITVKGEAADSLAYKVRR